jgi:hypothetical protein
MTITIHVPTMLRDYCWVSELALSGASLRVVLEADGVIRRCTEHL